MCHSALDVERGDRGEWPVDSAAEEMGELRERLRALVRRRPDDAGPVMRTRGSLVKAALAEQRLSPRARKDLAESLGGR